MEAGREKISPALWFPGNSRPETFPENSANPSGTLFGKEGLLRFIPTAGELKHCPIEAKHQRCKILQ